MDREDIKAKHLEFIQGVINRHNSNSFMLKGWSVTIAAALYALAGTVENPLIVLTALAPTLLLWGLDAFYLSNERCFVDLYNAVVEGGYKLPRKQMFKSTLKNDSKEMDTGSIPPYNMNFNKFKIWKNNTWIVVLKSKTIFWFYFPLVIITFLVMALFAFQGVAKSSAIEIDSTRKSDELEVKIDSELSTIINKIHPEVNSVDSTNESTKEVPIN